MGAELYVCFWPPGAVRRWPEEPGDVEPDVRCVQEGIDPERFKEVWELWRTPDGKAYVLMRMTFPSKKFLEVIQGTRRVGDLGILEGLGEEAAQFDDIIRAMVFSVGLQVVVEKLAEIMPMALESPLVIPPPPPPLPPPPPPTPAPLTSSTDDQIHRCELCQVTLNGRTQLEDHLRGKFHRKVRAGHRT
jgi:hypothetical protein